MQAGNHSEIVVVADVQEFACLVLDRLPSVPSPAPPPPSNSQAHIHIPPVSPILFNYKYSSNIDPYFLSKSAQISRSLALAVILLCNISRLLSIPWPPPPLSRPCARLRLTKRQNDLLPYGRRIFKHSTTIQRTGFPMSSGSCATKMLWIPRLRKSGVIKVRLLLIGILLQCCTSILLFISSYLW